MKKLTAIVLTLLLCVGLLAGCGITVVQYTGEGAVSPAPEEETPSGEPVEVPEGELALGFNMVANLAFGHSGSAMRRRRPTDWPRRTWTSTPSR